MGLFTKKESKVKLVSYQYMVDVEKKQTTYKVTLQNSSAEVVTQTVRLCYKIRSLVSAVSTNIPKSVTLNPFETKTFEFTIDIRVDSFKTQIDKKNIKKGKNSYWVEL
jgi:hypothetical protein